jgi:hypothetical protein
MSENQKTNAKANSSEFRRGLEAGINSEDTKYWQAGYELGQELSDREPKEPVKEVPHTEPDTPLLLMDTLDGKNGDVLDEKDATAE